MAEPYCLLLLVIAFFAILSPANVHILIMILDKLGNLSNLSVSKDTTVLQDRIAVAFHEKLGRAALSKLFVAGMHVHTFHYAKRCKIQIVPRHLKIVIFWHCSVLHVFQVLLQVTARNGKLNVVH